MKTVRYLNSWYRKCGIDSKYNSEYFTVPEEPAPVQYKGYLIYTRMEDGYNVYDVVKKGICVGQYNGIENGAKPFINTLIKQVVVV